MDIQPLGNRLIAERKEYRSKAGIIIPAGVRDLRLCEGVILKCGPGVEYGLKAGDKILWGNHAGGPLERNGQEYVIMNDDDVLATIKGDKK